MLKGCTKRIMNNSNVEIEKTEILNRLEKFNANMRNSSKNVSQRMFFVEDARQQRTEELVSADKLPALFREG